MDQETRNATEVQLNVYDTYRKYVIHQDNVINYRMTWLLTIHGFLYATYGFTLQKKMEVFEKLSDRNYESSRLFDIALTANGQNDEPLLRVLKQANFFLGTIIFVGFFISVIALLLIWAASKSSKNLIGIGDKSMSLMTAGNLSKISHDTNGLVLFPIYQEFHLTSLTGGGSRTVPKVGRCLQYCIPSTLILSWVFSGMFSFLYT